MGFAGVLAGCCGVAGAVVGMAQVYYTGPIARKIGMFGADLGFEVCTPFLTRGCYLGITECLWSFA